MTDTTESAASSQTSGQSLSDLRMPELQALAARIGITGVSKLRKPDLVEAIRAKRRERKAAEPSDRGRVSAPSQLAEQQPTEKQQLTQHEQSRPDQSQGGDGQGGQRNRRRGDRPRQNRQAGGGQDTEQGGRDDGGRDGHEPPGEQDPEGGNGSNGVSSRKAAGAAGVKDGKGVRDAGSQDQPDQKMASLDEIIHFPEPADRDAQEPRSRRNNRDSSARDSGSARGGLETQGPDDDSDDERPGRRRRGRDRYRDRKRRQTGRESSPEEEVHILEDDVLIPIAGILDVLENYAFVRTSGYLPGASDVYVSLGQVKKSSLRRGDAITGAVRQPREGEGQRQKFNALVRLDTVNGVAVEEATERPEFEELTATHPQSRLRLETEPRALAGRAIDLLAPIGKGQRALLRAQPGTGTTTLMQELATAVAANHPEVHLMAVLVDQRPEEVTDWQRSVAGEVIASPFDHSAADHCAVAELALDRAKRLVELGQDVVILLDSWSQLARAYNLAAAPGGRLLPGGVDAGALQAPKSYFGAARNIENGGSLTIVAASVVDTGSELERIIGEELRGTENASVSLLREIADVGIFPAIDPLTAATRRVEHLMSEDEIAAVGSIRAELTGMTPAEAAAVLRTRLQQSDSNPAMLLAVSRTSVGALV